jgi:hypothetical protein
MTTYASLGSARATAYADLGDAWLRNQTARLHQAHLQFGQRWQLDVNALLARAAHAPREPQPASIVIG